MIPNASNGRFAQRGHRRLRRVRARWAVWWPRRLRISGIRKYRIVSTVPLVHAAISMGRNRRPPLTIRAPNTQQNTLSSNPDTWHCCIKRSSHLTRSIRQPVIQRARAACLSTLLHGAPFASMQQGHLSSVGQRRCELNPAHRPSGLASERGRLGKSRSFVEWSPIGSRFLNLRTYSLPTRHNQHNNYVVAARRPTAARSVQPRPTCRPLLQPSLSAAPD